MANLKQILTSFGLSEKERAVFLSMIKLGPSTVRAISRDSKITRTLVYDIAEDLTKKGIISEINEEKVKKYKAVSYAGLVAVFSRQTIESKKLEKQLQQASSEFSNLEQGKEQKTKVRFFTGIEGVKSVYDEVIRNIKKSNNEVFSIFSPDKLEKTIPDWGDHDEYFNNTGISMKHIMAESPSINRYIRQIKKYTNNKYRVWKKEDGEFPTDTICWGNNIAYIDLSGYPSGIIIENQAITDTFKMWFDKMWSSLQDDRI
jgi:predicted transcriptional regulator